MTWKHKALRLATEGSQITISTKNIYQILGLPEEGSMLTLLGLGAYHSVFVYKYFADLQRVV